MKTNYPLIIATSFSFSLFILYHSALSGPLLYDDFINLSYILDIEDIHSFDEIIKLSLDNQSGPFGRPVSMFTFVLQKYFNYVENFDLKLINLIIHLINSILIYVFIIKLQNFFPHEKINLKILALVASTIWLIHPLHIGTILYTIQRMAQLSTLFSLSALIAFLHYYSTLQAQHDIKRFIKPSVIIFSFAIMGIFSKENAILTFPVILLLNQYLRVGKTNSNIYRLWVFTGFGLPTLYALYHIIRFAIQADYAFKGFTLTERILTESRVLIEYLSQIIFPNINQMTIFHDDIIISNSIIDPVTTIFSIIGIVFCLIVSFHKKTHTIVKFGILWFFIWHIIESTILPLNIYFEHRNYLPSIGIVLIISYLLTRLLSNSNIMIKYIPLIIVLVFNFASTYHLSKIWSDKETLYMYWLENHPSSQSALITYISFIEKKYSIEVANNILLKAITLEPFNSALSINLMLYIENCKLGKNNTLLENKLIILSKNPDNYHSTVITSINNLAIRIKSKDCRPENIENLSSILHNISVYGPQKSRSKWLSELYLYHASILLEYNYYTDALSLIVNALEKTKYKYELLIPIIELNIKMNNMNEVSKWFDYTDTIRHNIKDKKIMLKLDFLQKTTETNRKANDS